MVNLNNLSPEQRKEFFSPYIADLISNGSEIQEIHHDTGTSMQTYYLLRGLPQNRMALYDSGYIFVITGFDGYGFPIKHDNVRYSAQSLKTLFRWNVNLKEKDLVKGFKLLIKHNKSLKRLQTQ